MPLEHDLDDHEPLIDDHLKQIIGDDEEELPVEDEAIFSLRFGVRNKLVNTNWFPNTDEDNLSDVA